MIADYIVSVIAAFLQGLIELVPVFSLPSGFTSGSWIPSVAAWYSYANGFFPFFDLVICLGALMTAKVALLAWDAIMWVYKQLPFKAT